MNKFIAITAVAVITGAAIYTGNKVIDRFFEIKHSKKKPVEQTEPTKKQQVGKERFDKLYDLVAVDAAYNSEWANGTGYFNGLAEMNDTRHFRSVDQDGRRIINTPWGVIFQRYSDNPYFFVCHERGNMSRDVIFTEEDYEVVMASLENE